MIILHIFLLMEHLSNYFFVSARDGHSLCVPSPRWLQEPFGACCCRVLSLIPAKHPHRGSSRLPPLRVQTHPSAGSNRRGLRVEWGQRCVLVSGLEGEESRGRCKAAEPGLAVAQLRRQWTYPGDLRCRVSTDGHHRIGQEGAKSFRKI